MQAFTLILPALLPKLEVVRQILESHGLHTEIKESYTPEDPTKAGWAPTSKVCAGDWVMAWEWERGMFSIEVALHLDCEPGGHLTVELNFPDGQGWSGYGFYPEGFLSGTHWLRLGDGQRLFEDDLILTARVRGLVGELPGTEHANDQSPGLDETAALEGIRMICDFFVKLPVEQPKAA